MLRLALRGLAARKLRSALTAVAVVLGVAMIAGTYVLTDTIDRSFDRIFAATNAGVDVKVVGRTTVATQDGSVPPVDAALLTRIRGVDGVAEAAGEIFGTAAIVGRDGKPLTSGGTPAFVGSTVPARFDAYRYREGRAPTTAGEVAMDPSTARRGAFSVGDSVRIAGQADTRRYRLTGIAGIEGVDSVGGSSVAVLTLPEAQRVTGREGEFDDILVAAREGTSPEELREAVGAAVPASAEVRTGAQDADAQSAEIGEELGFLTTALLAFAGIALFVGGFTIFNTFSITTAQRTREFAMLRTLGASRRQILASVVAEAAVIGLVASLVGLLAGIGLAGGLNALFKAIGIELPASGTVIATRTVVVALVVGVGLTVLASLVPALRATRVAPVVALREGAVLPSGRGARLRTPVAALLTAAGVVLMLVGLFGGSEGGDALTLLGAGAALTFLGVALLSSRLVRPLAWLVGRPLERFRGLRGKLARENTMRNTGRTAITAAALMIGLALVTFVTIFAAGTRASIDAIVDRSFQGDLVVQHTDGFSPIPSPARRALTEVPGVATASALRASAAEVRGVEGVTPVSGLDPATATQVLALRWVEGSSDTLRGLAPTDAVVGSGWAQDHGVRVGERLAATTPTAERRTYTVRGVFDDRAAVVGSIVLPAETVTRDFGVRQDSAVFATLAPGASAEDVERRVSAQIAERFPTVDVQTREAFKDQQSGEVNQLLGLFYALLSLAVIVSLFGIVNTLALSILERTRELGMLRAVGMSRRQMRRVVRYEAVITALIGGVLGSALGVFFAVIVTRALEDEGFVLSVPLGTLAILLVLAAVAGVVAAVLPARRAARLNVLDALAYD